MLKPASSIQLQPSPAESRRSALTEASSYAVVKTGCFNINPGSAVGRKLYLAQMILLPFIPIAALIVQNIYSMASVTKASQEAAVIQKQISVTAEIAELLNTLQQERGQVALYVFGGGKRHNLDTIFTFTDEIIIKSSWNEWNNIFKNADPLKNHLKNLKYNGNTDDNISSILQWYNKADTLILEQFTQVVRDTATGKAWRLLIAYQNILQSEEYFSAAMTYGLQYYGTGHLRIHSFSEFIRHITLAKDHLNATKYFSNSIYKDYDRFQTTNSFYNDITIWHNAVQKNEISSANISLADKYYRFMIHFLGELKLYKQVIHTRIRNCVDDDIMNAATREAIVIALFVLVLAISPIIIALVRNATNTIQQFSMTLEKQTIKLLREQRKSDTLLSQMLPPQVVTKLRQQKQVPAEDFECVTVYFSDIVGFTLISAKCSAMEVVTMLNYLYRLFDSRIQKYDVYKVETIGDAYMVVSGLPLRNGNRHAGEIATMSLDLLHSVKHFLIPHCPDQRLQIRIGINTGPCVAGVVGTTMPRYCLFGDTINTASRMESTGNAMAIHISEETKKYLDFLGGYITEFRGNMEVKGKGNMNTYWLLGKEDGLKYSEDTDIIITDIEPEYLQILGDD